MLTKVSIKDHPHREQIVDLTKEIHGGEPKHLWQGKNTCNYLMQAKAMFESMQLACSSTALPAQPQSKPGISGSNTTKVLFAQTVKEGKQWGIAVFPPKLGPTNIPVTPRPKEDWQMVQRKKATHQGTKSTMVSGVVPISHQIPCDLLLSTNDEVLTCHFGGISSRSRCPLG